MATLGFMEKKKKRSVGKRVLRITIVFAVLLIILAGSYIGYLIYQYNYGTFKGYRVKHSIEEGSVNSARYKSYKGELLKYSQDGAMTLDAKGKYIWSGSYEMLAPIVDTCGNYVVVADQAGKQFYIYDETGSVNNITVDYSILDIQIASQGVVAVLMQEDNQAYIRVYDKQGKLRGEISKDFAGAGLPLSIALSNDGTKVIASFLDVSSGKIKTNVVCYGMDETARNEEQQFIGGVIYDGEIVAKVDFITNDIACFYKEQGFSLYSLKRKLSSDPIIEKTFDVGVRSIFSSSSYLGFVLDSSEEKYLHKVVLYDLKGKVVLEQNINFDYDNVTINDEEILFYNHSECYIMNVKGKERFQHRFDENIHAMSYASKDKYYVIYGNRIEIIQLKGRK